MSARDESAAEKLLEALDPDQRAVAQYAAGPMAVLAGAGTGKTRAITYRIAYGVARGIYDPANVLAVTFTKRAAVEMRERLAALGVPGVQARTFHSAALRQLQFFWPSAIGGSMPPLIEHKASLISSAAARLGIRADKALVRDLAAEVEWAKVSMLDADAYADAVRTNTRTTPGDLSVDDVLSVMDAYQIAKEDRGVLDFEDVLVLTAGIMQDYPPIAKRIRDQYRYFVVDEYQDVSALQQHLLNLWLGGRHDICVVGDVAQTIYSFAGASPRYLQDFADAHKGARVVELVRDYRSTPQIVSAANALMKGEHSSVLKGAVKLVSQREDGVPVSYRSFDDDAEEARGIAEEIRQLHEAGAAYSSIAILYRTNGQSESFEAQLTEAGIPFIVHSGMRFFEREEVRRAMYLLKKQATMLRNEGKDENDLVQLVEDLVGIAGWSAKAPSGQGALRERWDNLNAIVEMARQRRDTSFIAFVADLAEREVSQAAPATQGVTLSTLHAAKGLEWDKVFVVGVSEGLIPISLAQGEDAIEEEKRLLYVGMTRARDRLCVSYSRSRHGGNGKRKASRFLKDLWPRDDKSRTRVGRGGALEGGRSKKNAARAARADFEENNSPEVIELFERLRAWRKAEAEARLIPAFTVLTDKTLRDVAIAQPKTLVQLRVIKGIGEVKIDYFGPQILAIIRGEEVTVDTDPA